MSSLSLRLPESLHEKIRELAERDNISINQFIATAVAEKAAALPGNTRSTCRHEIVGSFIETGAGCAGAERRSAREAA